MTKRKIEKVEVGENTYVLQTLTLGEANDIMRECSTFEPMSGTLNIDTQKLGELRLTKMLKEWSEKEDDGKVKPITQETVRDLPEDIAAQLLIRMRGTGVVPPELAKKLGG